MKSQLAALRIQRLAPALGIIALAFSSGSTAPVRDVHSSPMALYGADAAGIDRNARDYKALDQVEWKSTPGSASQSAVVFGDPTKPGMYVSLLKRGPNDWSAPHSHPNDRFLTVLKGTMLIGTGTSFDKKNTVALGPGSMIRDIAGQVHYDGTGPDGLVLEISGMGPTARIEPAGK